MKKHQLLCLVLVWFVSVAEAQSRKSRNGNLSPASPMIFAQVPSDQAQASLPPSTPPNESVEDRLQAIEQRTKTRLQRIEARARQRLNALERGQRQSFGYLDSQVRRAERATNKAEAVEQRLTNPETGLEAKATKSIRLAEQGAVKHIGEVGAQEAQQVLRAGRDAVNLCLRNTNATGAGLTVFVLLAFALTFFLPKLVRDEAKRELAALLPPEVRREWQARVTAERNDTTVVNQHDQINAERWVAEATAAVGQMVVNYDAASKEAQRATLMLLDDARAIRERAENFFRRGKYDLAKQSAKQILGGDGQPGLQQRMHEAMIGAEVSREAASVT